MYTLIESLNQTLEEALERRTPIFKASVADSVSSPVAKAIDLQHLPMHGTVTKARHLIFQLLSQFKVKFDFTFSSEQEGLFNKLIIKATSKEKNPKLLQMEFTELTNEDLAGIKRFFYVH